MSERFPHNRGPMLLDCTSGKLTTSMGAVFPSERAVFRGLDIHRSLADMSWIGLLVFGITGRKQPEKNLQLLESIWVFTSYPDARIWNNRVAALAGSARSSSAQGISAALAVSEAYIYGRQNEFQAISFFINTVKSRAAGIPLQHCVDEEMALHGRIAGYGRPLANADERIEPTMRLARELGLADGPHVALAYELERHLLSCGKNLRMNYGALVSAIGADLGFLPHELIQIFYPAFLAGMLPCYIEAAANPEGTLFPTPCSAINYQGPSQRNWAYAEAGIAMARSNNRRQADVA